MRNKNIGKKIIGIAKKPIKQLEKVIINNDNLLVTEKITGGKPTLEVKVLVPNKVEMITFKPEIVDTNITRDDIYKKLKSELKSEKSKTPRPEKRSLRKGIRKVEGIVKEAKPKKQVTESLKETDLKDDLIFKIRLKKDFKNLWVVLDNSIVKNFINFCSTLLYQNDLEFKVSNEIMEKLKIYTYLNDLNEDKKLFKFKPNEDLIHLIICVKIYESTLITQREQLPEKLVIIPKCSKYEFGKQILEIYDLYTNIKTKMDNFIFDDFVIENKNKTEIKWLLFNSEICIEKILVLAMENYIKTKIKSKPSKLNNLNNDSAEIIGMINYVKKLSLEYYNMRSNMEHTFMPNRLRRIRNILSRTESKFFQLKLEEAIRTVLEKIRKGSIQKVDMNVLKKLSISKTLFKVMDGEHLFDIINKKGKK